MIVTKSKLNYYPEEVYQNPKKTPVRKKKTRKNKKKTNSNVAIKILFLFSALILMGISLFILFGYANITKIRMEVTELERQRTELEKVKTDLVADLEGIKSSNRIETEAVNKLGMSYPKEGQIAYVSVKNTNDNLEDKTHENGRKNVFNLITSLF